MLAEQVLSHSVCLIAVLFDTNPILGKLYLGMLYYSFHILISLINILLKIFASVLSRDTYL
jgi:hypothetical protein